MYIYVHTLIYYVIHTFLYIYIILHIGLWVLQSVLAMRQVITCADFYFIYKTHVSGEIEEGFCSAAFCCTDTLKLQVVACLCGLSQKFRFYVSEFRLAKLLPKRDVVRMSSQALEAVACSQNTSRQKILV